MSSTAASSATRLWALMVSRAFSSTSVIFLLQHYDRFHVVRLLRTDIVFLQSFARIYQITFCKKYTGFLFSSAPGNGSTTLLLLIICGRAELLTASRPRSGETRPKTHHLDSSYRIYRHVDTVLFLSRPHHLLCDNAVHARTPHALQVKTSHLDNPHQRTDYHNHHHPECLHSHR